MSNTIIIIIINIGIGVVGIVVVVVRIIGFGGSNVMIFLEHHFYII